MEKSKQRIVYRGGQERPKGKKVTTLPDEIFDQSSRLLKCQRERLRWMKDTYEMSYADLAKYYGIGKSTAYYICNPVAAERKKLKWLKEFKNYYDSEKAVTSATKSRKKTKDLIEKFRVST